jgi:hypothetical protein
MSSTKIRTPIETLPYRQALAIADKALIQHLGRDIGKGWLFSGGVPYETAHGKLLYNLTIRHSDNLNASEERSRFAADGVDAVIDFLGDIRISTIAHYVVLADDEDLVETLLEL